MVMQQGETPQMAIERLEAENADLKKTAANAFANGQYRAYEKMAEQSLIRKTRCVEKCNHPADFVCDYEDGTAHCLECIAEKFWQLEDILSGRHNVHTYWGALETIAHPERYISKYDPVELARKALGKEGV
jgi:hypothetical protein